MVGEVLEGVGMKCVPRVDGDQAIMAWMEGEEFDGANWSEGGMARDGERELKSWLTEDMDHT